MPGISTRLQPSPRIAAIEQALKLQKSKAKDSVLESLCGGQILRVKNSNNTRFVMGMPPGDSPMVTGLALRYFDQIS